jgi:hypothetical protein
LATICSLNAWDAETHRKIAQSVISVSNYPEDLKNFLSNNSELIDQFAMHPSTSSDSCTTDSAKFSKRKIEDLIVIILERKRGKAVAEHMGRISHYIADIHHPLLDEDIDEEARRLYHHYEKGPFNLIEADSVTAVMSARHLENFEVELDSVIAKSNRLRPALLGPYLKTKERKKIVSDLLKEQLSSSIQCTADFWFTLWRLKESEPLGDLTRSSPTIEDFIKLARVDQKQHRENRVTGTFKNAQSALGDKEKIILAEIKFYFDHKNYPKAIEICENKIKEGSSSIAYQYQLAAIYDHWVHEENLSDSSKKEKAVSAWNTLLGTQFNGIAKQRIEKLKENQK